MARFGRELVRSLTQPAFMEDVRRAGMLAGSMPQRRREEEEKQERLARENEIFKIYEQGLRSSEDANVAGITAATGKLSGMLTEAQDESVRSDLMSKISDLGKLAAPTQAKKDQRNITDLIKAENLLDELDEKGEALTENERRVREGVQQRVDQLRQSASTVIGAENARRDARIARLAKDEEMAVAETNAMKRELGGIDPESPEWDKAANKYKKLGSVVEQLKNDLLDIKVKRQESQDKLAEGAPLSAEEIKRIKDLGLGKFLKGNDRADRALLARIDSAEIEKRVAMVLRPLDPATTALAKATVIDTLRNIVEQGEIERLPIAQDLSDKVEKMLEDPEEIELFLGRVEGASQAEIEGIVTRYLKESFPEKFAEMQTEINRKATIKATKRGELAKIAMDTNKARGTAAFEAGLIDEDRALVEGEEGYFDLNDPDDAERALMQYERDQRAERQAEQKTAEKETGIFTVGIPLN
jgi:hypothetical protein